MVENMTSRLRKLPQLVADGALALTLAAVDWLLLALRPAFEPRGGSLHPPQLQVTPAPHFIEAGPFGPSGSPSPWAYVVTAVSFLPLTLRRRFPLTVLALTSVGAAWYEAGHFPLGIAFLAPLVALYTVATLRDRRTVIVAGVLSRLRCS